ncbi:phosphatidylglycerophosphatase A family protein [Limobrevibacterium gyesilva]|uniref:Phosphatidylglycerophosphatase A n=1 Tax=Limobrevibacterium gyesilva TaxID=2991712 RepID=A0AA41YMX5_9PROT|nr:phosphatidylglycerophosphatase A [Limobrevibacterium gyesilva]MCW3475466.1 phosphatidylglycerophosphatase A [Limobrevibacterium gyesilva]
MTFARMIASGFGTGYAPKASGTVGSFAALLLGAALMLASPLALPAAALLASLGGLWAIRAAGVRDDPSWVVIDEFAGQWIALLPLAHPSPLGLLAAFLLFRLLDIAKPGPIGWADRQHGPVGVMLDDIIAGAIAAGILWAACSRWPGLLD